MSIRLIARALDRQDVRETAKLVLVGLADHANDAAECWPSIERLRQVASLTHPRHVYAALDKLIAAGLVTRESRPGKRSRFRLHLPCTPDASVTPDGGVTPDGAVTSPLTEASRVPLTPASLTPDASVTQTVTEPSGEPSVNRHTPAEGGERVSAPLARAATKSTRQASPAAGDERFARFWEAYPRKVAKGRARKAWQKLAPDAALTDSILDALAWQRTGDTWRTPRFIPHPGTYLSDRRWEDAPPEASDLRAAHWCETFAVAHAEYRRAPYTHTDEDRAAAREITGAVPDDLELDTLTRVFLQARNEDWEGVQRSPRLLLRNLPRLREHVARLGGQATGSRLGETPRQYTLTVTCSAKRPGCSGSAEVLHTEGQRTPRGVCERCRDPKHDVTVMHACPVCGESHAVSAFEAEEVPYACPRLPEGLRQRFGSRFHLARMRPESAEGLAADLRAVLPDSRLLAALEAMR